MYTEINCTALVVKHLEEQSCQQTASGKLSAATA